MAKQIKAVLFDMDGVLIDAREWHYEALNRALGIFGFSISRYEHLVTYDGLPTRRKLEMLSRERGLPSGLHQILNELKQQYTTQLIELHCRPTFAHQYALSSLSRSGLRLALCSNSIRATVERMLQKAAIKSYFDCVLSNQDVSAAKPSPEIFLTAAQRLGVDPAQCLVIEDNQNGIAAARSAGCHCLTVSDPSDVTFDNITRALAHSGVN